MIVGIDFDGTIVEHQYPRIGLEVPYAIDVMKELQEAGHKLILWTMRSDEYLEEAVKYVESQGIKFFGINENPEQKDWTNSPKAYCNVYIDDAALGCPLVFTAPGSGLRPYVDWIQVRNTLTLMGLLKA